MELITELTILMIVGFIGGLVAVRLKVPVIVGYILGGAVLTIFVDLKEHSALHSLAEVGIALLLFSIGVEFSLDKLLAVKKFALYGGIAQIILTMVLARIIFPLMGFTPYEALFLGAVFALSSTAVVVKVLEEIGQIETQASKIVIGWLILQDIAVVVLIILLGSLAGTGGSTNLVEALFKCFLLIAIALVIGRKVIPKILGTLARQGSKELLVVLAFGLCMFVALLAQKIVGSFTLGAFLAGIMISDSLLNHEIFSEIKPLQNIFALFFFVIIGTLFSFDYFFGNIFQIVLLLFIVTVGKILIVGGISTFLRMHIRNAVEVSLALAQVGEFAFLSATIGFSNNWIDADLASLIISVTVLSLLIAPLMIINTDKIYENLRERCRQRYPNIYRRFFSVPEVDTEVDRKLKNHMIVCGYGRVGKYVVKALRKMHVKYILIDIDAASIERLKADGYNALYGDATSEEILLQAGIEDAKAVIVALPKEVEVMQVLEKIKYLNTDIQVILRHHFRNVELDVSSRHVVVEPEFEAALKIVEKVVKFTGKRDRKIVGWLREQKDLIY